MRPQVVEQKALPSEDVNEDELWAYKLSGIMSPYHSMVACENDHDKINLVWRGRSALAEAPER